MGKQGQNDLQDEAPVSNGVYFLEKQGGYLAESGLNGLPVVADEEINRGMVGPLGVFLAGYEEVQILGLLQVVLHEVVGEAAVEVDLRARRQVQWHLPQSVDFGPRAGCESDRRSGSTRRGGWPHRSSRRP